MKRFDVGDVLAFMAGTAVVVLIIFTLILQGSFRRVSELPATCWPGDTVLHTSVSPAKFYRCEGAWKLQ